jgi:DNA invertase Pin-like site-specific DNA recombinase
MSRRPSTTPFIPLDKRDPSTVRAVVLARVSDLGAKVMEDTQNQVDRALELITAKGWRHVGTYRERVSGYLQVIRNELDAVMALAERHEIDVIVCREPDRVARETTQRHTIIGTARKLGVEVRFACYPPDGALPDTMEAKIVASVTDALIEYERNKILGRTWPRRLERLQKGIPGTGRGGRPPYGYRWQLVDGKEDHTRWDIHQGEAERVRSWYRRLEMEEAFTLRALVIELNTAHVPTPTGIGLWTATTLSRILSNPLYCGKGRVHRWRTIYEQVTQEGTGRVFARRTNTLPKDALTYAVAEGAIPPLVDVALWERVQAGIASRRTRAGRLDRSASPHTAEETLLHGGLVVCAHCGGGMSRFWRNRDSGGPLTYYRCNQRGTNPQHVCKLHSIPAPLVDSLARRLLAQVLTDPAAVVALADASLERLEDARTAVGVTAATLDALRARLDEITRDTRRYEQKLALSDAEADAEEIAIYQDKLARLASQRERAEQALAVALPRSERAQEKARILEAITTHRRFLVSKRDGVMTVTGTGELVLAHSVSAKFASDVLGIPEDDLPMRVQVGFLDEGDGQDTVLLDVDTLDVVEALLRQTPPAQVRRLFMDLGAVVQVSRPRPPSQRDGHGTPPAQRVSLRVGELVVQAETPRSASVAKLDVEDHYVE